MNIQTYLKQGKSLAQEEKYTEAKEIYLEAATIAPDVLEIYQQLGVICVKLQQLPEAIQQYNRALEIAPNNSGLHCRKADILVKQNQLIPATKAYKKAIELDPNNAYANFELGKILLQLSPPKWDEAEVSFRKVIDLKPETTWAYYFLGEILKKQLQWEEAKSNFLQFLELEPNNEQAYRYLGEIYNIQGKFPKAVNSYKKCLDIDPSFYWNNYHLADIFYKDKKYKQATKYYEIFLNSQSDFAEAHYKLGETYSELNKFKEAEESYKKAISYKDNYCDALYGLGLIYLKQQKYLEAEQNLQKTIECNDAYTNAYASLADCSIQQNKYPEAKNILESGIDRCEENLGLLKGKLENIKINIREEDSPEKPQSKQEQKAQEEFLEGERFATQENWEKAIEHYQKAVEIDPNYSWCWCCLAQARQQKKKYDDAIKAYKKAIEIKDKSPWYHKCLGELYFNLGEWEEAVESYKKALKIEPNNYWNCDKLGHAYYKIGEWSEAEKAFEKAQKIHPYDEEIYNKLIKVLIEQNKLKKAVEVSEKAIELIPDRQEIYENSLEVLAKGGDKDKAKYQQLLKYKKLYQEIEQLKAKVRKNNKDFVSYETLANKLVELKKWSNAAAIYRQANNLKSDNTSYFYGSWGEALIKIGHFNKAESVLNKAIEKMDPELPQQSIYENLGKALFELGKWEKIVQIAKLNPDSAQLLEYKGKALSRLGRWKKAIEVYQNGLEKFAAKKWWCLRAYQSLGKIYGLQKNWQEAELAYGNAIDIIDSIVKKNGVTQELNTRKIRCYYGYGDSLFNQGKLKEAESFYIKAKEESPTNISWRHKLSSLAWSYHYKGDKLLDSGKYPKAIEYYNKAIELDSDCYWHYYSLGVALTKIEKWQEAYEIKEKAHEIAQKYPDMKQNPDDALTQMKGWGLVICIHTNSKNQHKQKAIRDTWVSKAIQDNIPYLFVMGKPSSQSYVEGNVLYVDSPDSYEHRPEKIYKTLEYIHNKTFYSYVMNVDDNSYINLDRLLDSNFSNKDYMGIVNENSEKSLKTKYLDFINSSIRDKSPGKYQGDWTDRDSGYFISRYGIKKFLEKSEPQKISSQLYDDKLVGDLLRLSEIEPTSSDKYLVGVEKWDSSTGHKLAFVPEQEADYPHNSNNIVLFHSDNAPSSQYQIDRQYNNPNYPRKKFLRNFSWFDPQQKQHICLERKDDREIKLKPDDILCFIVERNESLRLPYMLKYYRERGVDKFFIVDNHSTDHTRSFLLAQDDVYLWHTSRSYAGSQWGVDWTEILLQNYAFNHWCVLVDADELLYYPDFESKDLHQLCDELNQNDKQGMSTVLLDMYSKAPIKDAKYKEGQNFLDICSHFDRKFYTSKALNGGERNITAYFGGLRQRVFGGGSNSFCINKAPLIKYDYNIRLYEGFHWIGNVNLASFTGCLLHFKYFSTFHEYAKQEAQRGEHWNGGSEYIKYANKLEANPQLSFWDTNLSQKFENSETLLEFGAMKRGKVK